MWAEGKGRDFLSQVKPFYVKMKARYKSVMSKFQLGGCLIPGLGWLKHLTQ